MFCSHLWLIGNQNWPLTFRILQHFLYLCIVYWIFLYLYICVLYICGANSMCCSHLWLIGNQNWPLTFQTLRQFLYLCICVLYICIFSIVYLCICDANSMYRGTPLINWRPKLTKWPLTFRSLLHCLYFCISVFLSLWIVYLCICGAAVHLWSIGNQNWPPITSAFRLFSSTFRHYFVNMSFPLSLCAHEVDLIFKFQW